MQYVFIFQALLEHYLYGDTELEVTSLESHLAKLYSPLPGAGCGGLEAEFKVGVARHHSYPYITRSSSFMYRHSAHPVLRYRNVKKNTFFIIK